MKQQESKLIDATKQLLRAYGYFVDTLWHVDDVLFICEQHDIPRLTNEEAMQVFTIATEQFDGETGISWPRLERALQTFLRQKAALSELNHNPTDHVA